MKRHIGKLTNTDQRVVVVMMQIPNRESHALTVSTDSLPPYIHDNLMEVLDSQEGQNDPVLANVLARRTISETGKTVLQTLHEAKLLTATPVGLITMLPRPNMPFPLRTILEQMGKVVPAGPQDVDPSMHAQKFNTVANNVALSQGEEQVGMARNLLIEADDLEGIARSKRDHAYRLAPSLRPQMVTLSPKPAYYTDAAYTAPVAAPVAPPAAPQAVEPKAKRGAKKAAQ